MSKFLIIAAFLSIFVSLPATIFSQDYISDTLAVRAILDSNNLDTIPVQSVTDSINGRIRNLYFININMTCLPAEIGVLTNLEDVWLYGNNLTTLPPEIGNLSNLILLNLENNRLSSVPPEIGNLSNLEVLELSFNNLTSFPSEIGGLYSLVVLKANHNNLTSLPPEIGGLWNLNHLNLFKNNLATLPDSIVYLTTWDTLDLDSNNLKRANLSDPVISWLDTYHPDWLEHQNTPVIYHPNHADKSQKYLIFPDLKNYRINYYLPSSGKIRLDVLDLKGRFISILFDGFKQAGKHSVNWNKNNFSSGIFYIRFTTNNNTIIKKAVFIY